MTFFTPILAFFATALMIVLLRPLAISIGLVDIPSERKSHSGNIPLIGGLSIFVGALAALFMHYSFSGRQPGEFFIAACAFWCSPGASDYRCLG